MKHIAQQFDLPISGETFALVGERVKAEPLPKRWDDPALWDRISVGNCSNCNGKHILRDRVCWRCEMAQLAEAQDQDLFQE